jgi:hypothetical protein
MFRFLSGVKQMIPSPSPSPHATVSSVERSGAAAPGDRAASPSPCAPRAATPRSRAASETADISRSIVPCSAATTPSCGATRPIVPGCRAAPRAIGVTRTAIPVSRTTIIGSAVETGSPVVGAVIERVRAIARSAGYIASGAASLWQGEEGEEGGRCKERDERFHNSSLIFPSAGV